MALPPSLAKKGGGSEDGMRYGLVLLLFIKIFDRVQKRKQRLINVAIHISVLAHTKGQTCKLMTTTE